MNPNGGPGLQVAPRSPPDPTGPALWELRLRRPSSRTRVDGVGRRPYSALVTIVFGACPRIDRLRERNSYAISDRNDGYGCE